MLPNKCPFCNKNLSVGARPKPNSAVSASCPDNNPFEGRFSHYFYRLKDEDVVERIIVGEYVVCNYKNNKKNGAEIYKYSTYFNANCMPKLIIFIKDIRIPPTITEKKLQTYIAFS